MVPGDERYERLKHQSLFLHTRGLMSPEMEELERQLVLFERLTGKDSSKLDPHLVDRIHGDLEKAVMEQLRASGLLDRWLVSWEARSERANVHALVPTQESPSRSLEEKLVELEHAVQLLSEHLAGRLGKADEPGSGEGRRA